MGRKKKQRSRSKRISDSTSKAQEAERALRSKSDAEKSDELDNSFKRMKLKDEEVPVEDIADDLMDEEVPVEDIADDLMDQEVPGEDIADDLMDQENPKEMIAYYLLLSNKDRRAKSVLKKSTNPESGYYYRVKSQIESDNSLENAKLAVKKVPNNIEFRKYYLSKLVLNVDRDDFARYTQIMVFCAETIIMFGIGDDSDDEELTVDEAYIWEKHDEAKAVILTELEGTLFKTLHKLFDAGVVAALFEAVPLWLNLSMLGVSCRFIAALLHQNGNHIEALTFAYRAVKNFPGCFEYNAFFGYLLFEAGKDYSIVITQCEIALEMYDSGLEIKSDTINMIIPTDEYRIKRLK
ncbi:hypothetical protein FRX31_016036, partial [Thalictrum thalictroides]